MALSPTLPLYTFEPSSRLVSAHPVTPWICTLEGNDEPDAEVPVVSRSKVARFSPALAVIAATRMAFNGRINLPKSRNVYRMPELLNTILEYCDHSTVMAVSRVDCHGRLQAQNEIRSRIRSLVTQFIDSNHFLSFMNMLATTGAVIIGSVARRLFTINAIYMEDLRGYGYELYGACNDLNLATPPGQKSVCVQWLSDHGYGSWTPDHDATPKPAFVHSARAFVKGDKVLSQKVRETSGTDSDSDDDLPQIARVTVTESRKGVMAVVLSSTYTAQMNAISSTTLYCFYPNLANSLYCLQSDLTRNHLNRRVWSPFKYQDTNSDWAEPCGPFCPAVPRKTKGDQGVASFRWNPRIDVPPSRDPHTDHLLAEQTLKWRYSKFCRNRGCSLYTPVASSSRLI